MPDGRRAFCMGNALVVGLIERVAAELVGEVAAREARQKRRRSAAVAS